MHVIRRTLPGWLSILFLAALPLQAQPILGYFPEYFEIESDEYPADCWAAFNIGNSGNQLLTWELSVHYLIDPEDHHNDWLAPLAMEGQTEPGEISLVPIRINTAEMEDGQYDAEIIIHSNDPRDQVFNFLVTASFDEIGSRSMQLFPSEVKFEGHYGLLQPNQIYYASVCVANLGENPIHLDSAVIHPEIFEFNFAPINVDPGDYATYGLMFTSDTAGEFVGTLTVYSSDAGFDGAQYIPVSARIFENSVPAPEISHSEFFILHSVFPNPFNSSTTISYDISRSGFVRLGIYDAMGRKVKTLNEGSVEPGRHTILWSPNSLPGGNYTIGMEGSYGRSFVRRVLLIK